MGQVIQIDEARIRDHLGEMVRGTVEETLNALLEAEADQLCGAGHRQIAKDVMVELDLKKITAPDFSASIREGIPSLMVLNEDAVPSIYWQPSEPRLKRQELAYELKQGAEIAGVALTDPEPVLSIRVR
jgi:hypothetical protein